MSKPVKAKDIGNLTREYEYADGRKEYRVGGSRSWRNNNPGNIRDYDIPWQGLIGQDNEQFCIFNSYENGKRALTRDITTKAARGLTLEKMIRIYAPPTENDTEAYIESVSRQTGVPRNLPVAAFKDKIPAIADAMEKHEGYVEGEIKNSPNDESETKKDQKGKYIWRTQGDSDVRSSHADRDGKIFSWNTSPAGGHPGEDYGCRCYAEPVDDEVMSSNMFDSELIQSRDEERNVNIKRGLSLFG